MNTVRAEYNEKSVFHLMEKSKDEIAMKSSNGTIVSYGELNSFVVQWTPFFDKKSIVLCLCENVPGAVAGYVATLENQMTAFLLDAKLQDDILKEYLEDYHPAFLWLSEEKMQQLTQKHMITEGQILIEQWGYLLVQLRETDDVIHEDLALLLATSGSTGDPKLVRISFHNLKANAKSICEYLEITRADRPITTLPMQYTFGLSIINSHLLSGATILMTTDSYVQTSFWDFFNQEQATSFSGVPYSFEILNRVRILNQTFPSLQKVTQAGGKLSDTLQKKIAEWMEHNGGRFYVMYGQTEATARMGYLPWEEAKQRIGSIGKAIPGGTFWLEDEQGNIIDQANEVGELIYQGSNVSMGYALCCEDLALEDCNRGILRTGDMARRDEDGYYYIVGRKKRFIKLFGVRISLDQCESYLKNIYPEYDMACSGSDDQLCIYVAPRFNEKMFQNDDMSMKNKLLDQIIVTLSEHLHMNKKAFRGIFVDKIPKNANGKVLYQKLGENEA